MGLAVNLLSAWLLGEDHHDDGHGDAEANDHPDHNLRAAYLHVLADAMTSISGGTKSPAYRQAIL